MTRKQVGIWMYENSGGSQIQKKMVDQLREREIESICGLNLAQASAKDGTVFCQGKDLSELELFFSYNAGEQTPYQVYLYQTIDSMMPMINNYTSFALSEDKFRTAHKLKQAGVTATDYIVCNRANLDQVRDQLVAWDGQAICKPVDGWGGNGIIKLEQTRDIDLLAPFLKAHSSSQFYLERVIQNDFSDYRIDIVDGKFVACYGRKAASGSWKTNISSGGHVILREPLPEVVELAQQAAFVTGLEIAGVDIIYDIEKQRYVVIEVNGIPAFATPEQEAFGLNFNDTKINYIVDLIDRNVNPAQSQSMTTTLDTSFIHLNSNHSNTQQVEISL